MVFNLALLIIYPMFIAPLFNKFTPLTDPDLAGRIQRLAQRCGFALNGLFVMDGSVPRTANACFTGFGRSRHCLLHTLLARLATRSRPCWPESSAISPSATSLTDPDLAGRIQRLAQRCGFALNGLF